MISAAESAADLRAPVAPITAAAPFRDALQSSRCGRGAEEEDDEAAAAAANDDDEEEQCSGAASAHRAATCSGSIPAAAALHSSGDEAPPWCCCFCSFLPSSSIPPLRPLRGSLNSCSAAASSESAARARGHEAAAWREAPRGSVPPPSRARAQAETARRRAAPAGSSLAAARRLLQCLGPTDTSTVSRASLQMPRWSSPSPASPPPTPPSLLQKAARAWLCAPAPPGEEQKEARK